MSYTLDGQKYTSNINYTCTKCAIYWQNIQFGSRIGIEMYNYWKYIVLVVTFVKIWKPRTFNEVLIYQFINELIKYWTPDIHKSIVNK